MIKNNSLNNVTWALRRQNCSNSLSIFRELNQFDFEDRVDRIEPKTSRLWQRGHSSPMRSIRPTSSSCFSRLSSQAREGFPLTKSTVRSPLFRWVLLILQFKTILRYSLHLSETLGLKLRKVMDCLKGFILFV
jgi:hypothetical protein